MKDSVGAGITGECMYCLKHSNATFKTILDRRNQKVWGEILPYASSYSSHSPKITPPILMAPIFSSTMVTPKSLLTAQIYFLNPRFISQLLRIHVYFRYPNGTSNIIWPDWTDNCTHISVSYVSEWPYHLRCHSRQKSRTFGSFFFTHQFKQPCPGNYTSRICPLFIYLPLTLCLKTPQSSLSQQEPSNWPISTIALLIHSLKYSKKNLSRMHVWSSRSAVYIFNEFLCP